MDLSSKNTQHIGNNIWLHSKLKVFVVVCINRFWKQTHFYIVFENIFYFILVTTKTFGMEPQRMCNLRVID
jgi:hypothetical protein